MTALEMELIVVPDSIEPYIGFKYLSWYQGKLWSQWGDKPWPINKPFEAECHASTEYEWRLVGGRANAPKQAENDYYDEDAVPPMPQVLPPPGMSWSWEEKPSHDAVEESCKCGIYAVDTPEGCEEYGPNPSPKGWITFHLFPDRGTKLLVELAIWGKVIPGTTGMRGQFAYPQVIHGSSDEAKQAAEAYGVPQVLRDHQQPRAKKAVAARNPAFTSAFYGDYTASFYGTTAAPEPTSTPHKSQDLRLEFFKTIGAILP